MENSIIARNLNKFANKELTKHTNTIIRETEKTAKSLITIALTIKTINDNELYKDDFESIVQYGEKVFGYKKTAIYNMLKVADNYFIDGVNHSIFVTDEKKDFTFNQLTRFLPLPSVEVANELVEKEMLTPDMTVKEITKVVKDYNHKDEELTEEATEESTEEATEGATVDTIEVAFTQALNAYDILITEYAKNGDEELTHILEAMKDKLSHIREGYQA